MFHFQLVNEHMDCLTLNQATRLNQFPMHAHNSILKLQKLIN